MRWWIPALLVVGWLVLGALGGPFTGRLAEVAENDNAAFLPNSAEATEVVELQRAFSTDEVLPAIVVAERKGGLTEADNAYLAGRAAAVGRLDGIAGQLSPPQRTQTAMQFMVPIAGEGNPADVVTEVRAELAKDTPAGLTVLVTGPAGQIADLIEAFGGIDGLLIVVAGAVVAVILIIVYRSPVLPLLVLVSAVFALGVASYVVYQLAKHDVLASPPPRN